MQQRRAATSRCAITGGMADRNRALPAHQPRVRQRVWAWPASPAPSWWRPRWPEPLWGRWPRRWSRRDLPLRRRLRERHHPADAAQLLRHGRGRSAAPRVPARQPAHAGAGGGPGLLRDQHARSRLLAGLVREAAQLRDVHGRHHAGGGGLDALRAPPAGDRGRPAGRLPHAALPGAARHLHGLPAGGLAAGAAHRDAAVARRTRHPAGGVAPLPAGPAAHPLGRPLRGTGASSNHGLAPHPIAFLPVERHQGRGVVGQLRAPNPQLGQVACGRRRVVKHRLVEVVEGLDGHAEKAANGPEQHFGHSHGHGHVQEALPEDLREQPGDLRGRKRQWVGEVVGLSEARRARGKARQGLDDEVHRHDVGGALAAPRQREHPGRGQALHEAQDEIGAVELPGLAGARVADDDARPVDGPGQPALRHLHLGLELRALVVVLEALAHVEVGLAKDALRGAGDKGGGDVVQSGEALRLAQELQDVPGAEHVDAVAQLGAHRQVVHGGEVVALGHALAQVACHGRLEAEARPRDVAGHQVDAALRVTVRRLDGGDAFPRRAEELLLHQAGDARVGLQLQQAREQPQADEAGEAGEEEGLPVAGLRGHPRAPPGGRPIPGRQQSSGHTSWFGPRSPSARRGAPSMRSRTSSRIMLTNSGAVPTLAARTRPMPRARALSAASVSRS